MKRDDPKKALREYGFSSPMVLFAVLCGIIFLAEFAVMVILSFFGGADDRVLALLDPLLLLVVLAPTIYLLVVRPLRRTNRRLWSLAITDPLTKSFNRLYLMDFLRREFLRAERSGKSFAILALDVDHFKRINDDHGHSTGDQVLCELASLLRSLCRPYDIVARYGGEEFIVVLTETSPDHALAIAERYRKAIQHMPFPLLEQPVTVSIGVAAHDPAVTRTVDELIDLADANLYKAKERGRNRVIAELPAAA